MASASNALPLLAVLLAGTPAVAPSPTPTPAPTPLEVPAAEAPFELDVLLERARHAVRKNKPRDRALKTQVERLRGRARLVRAKSPAPKGTTTDGPTRLLTIVNDAKALAGGDAPLAVARVEDGVLVVDGDVHVAHARKSVVVATGAVSVAHATDSIVIGGLAVDVSHDARGILLSGGILEVSHANETVLYGRDVRAGGAGDRITCVNVEAPSFSCSAARDPSIDLGAAVPLPGALAGKLEVVETRSDAPRRLWWRETGGRERGTDEGAPLGAPFEGWRLAFARSGVVVFRKGPEVSAWRPKPRDSVKRIAVGTADGSVHLLDRQTLGLRESWPAGGTRRKAGPVRLAPGRGTAQGALPGGIAFELGRRHHPMEIALDDEIEHVVATDHGVVTLFQGRDLHLIRVEDGFGRGERLPVRIPVGGARPPRPTVLPDGTILTADNEAKEIVHARFDGTATRHPIGAEVERFFGLPDRVTALALLRGDEATPPAIAWLAMPSLAVTRTVRLPRPGAAHDAALSRDGARLVVAAGDRVYGVHLASGEVFWERETPGGAHVRYIEYGRLVLLAHGEGALHWIQDDVRGTIEATTLLGTSRAGHVLGYDHWTDTLVVIDEAGRRVLSVRGRAVVASEPFEAVPTDVVFPWG